MSLRVEHIIIVLTVTVLFFGFIYLGDFFFKESFNERQHRFDSQFLEVKSALDRGDHQRVASIYEQIIADHGTGLNEVQAKVYLGLSQLKMDQTELSIATLRFLIEKYPGLKKVYGDFFQRDSGNDNLMIIYDHILTDYLPSYSAGVNSEMMAEKLNDAMKTRRGYRLRGTGWSAFIALQIAAIALYERLRKSRSN